MRRFLILSFGIASYGMFALVFFYLIAFLGNLQHSALADALPFIKDLVPRSVDHGPMIAPWKAAAINIGLIALFGIQHTPMARRYFKDRWTRIVPVEVERSIYVFTSNVVVIALFYFWRPITSPMIWQADATWSAALLWGMMLFGFLFLFSASLFIDHLHLLGVKQAWQQFSQKPLTDPKFTNSFIYRLVRHPINLGWLIGFWGGPSMSAGHMLLAMGMTIYVLIAIKYEERDLSRMHPDYEQYRKEVPMLVPVPGRRRAQG